MPERPILILPQPERIEPPKGRGMPGGFRKPERNRQLERFSPLFGRLRDVLRKGSGMELRQDPASLAPDRVIVFEVAGSVQNFVRALSQVPGLEFMAEWESQFDADDDFSVIDGRKGREGLDRSDKAVPARLYFAMPDTRALEELVSLWGRWERGESLGQGYAPFRTAFEHLHDLRPWGPSDRIPAETRRYWEEAITQNPSAPVRTEVELWFHRDRARRERASQTFQATVTELEGRVLHESVIEEIGYHGLLIDVPQSEVSALLADRIVRVALADEVMFLRPQSTLEQPQNVELLDEAAEPLPVGAAGTPIAALLDGMPLQNHALLAGRIEVDDQDGLEARSVVQSRVHGTAMASLILHGDLNQGGPPLPRRLHARPILLAESPGRGETTDPDRLLVDVVHRAVVEMKRDVAPNVVLVNLSLGDRRRPFTGMLSPFARLLDYLSYRYGILFLVSAGNQDTTLAINGLAGWSAFEHANPMLRTRAVLEALHSTRHERSLLSPAESINSLSVGGLHDDAVRSRSSANAVDPFSGDG